MLPEDEEELLGQELHALSVIVQRPAVGDEIEKTDELIAAIEERIVALQNEKDRLIRLIKQSRRDLDASKLVHVERKKKLATGVGVNIAADTVTTGVKH